MSSLQMKLAEKISELSPLVENDVIESLVNRELTKRSNAIVLVMDKLSKLEGDLKKVRPDNTFDADGNKVSEYFTKAKIDEKNKLNQNIEKHTKAINKALEKADFGDVYNLSSGKSGDDQKPGGSPAEEATA